MKDFKRVMKDRQAAEPVSLPVSAPQSPRPETFGKEMASALEDKIKQLTNVAQTSQKEASVAAAKILQLESAFKEFSQTKQANDIRKIKQEIRNVHQQFEGEVIARIRF